MKTIFKVSVLALMGAALLASCAKEFDYEPVQKETKTFTLTFAQPDTKVAVTNEGKTTWEVGDEIMIHGGSSGQERQKVTLTADDISADGKKATITFDINPYDRTADGYLSKYYAQYPANLVPEGNMYYECRFSATNDFLMAACDVDDTFVFYNLCGIIAFEANGEFDNFKFEGNGGETVGYSNVYQVRVRNDASGMVVNYNKPGNESGDPVPMKSFAADIKDGVNYVFLPAGANFSAGFTFKFYDGTDLVKVAKSETAVKIDPGKILVLGDISSHIEDYVAPTTSDHQPAEWAASAIDLSYGKQAMANCYVIKAPGAYKIPALKGNSEDSVGNVFDVELVWETYNNATDVTANSVIAEVDFDNDNLYFKTPDALKAGNALIAAKDSEGNIIWSWHIWIPATNIESSTYGGIYSSPLMDRNLGALVAATTSSVPVESFGLHYEWGRKDPFVGALSISDNHFAKVSGTAISVGYEMTVAQTIANPATYAVYTEADSWGDWLSPANDATLWQDAEKTIYDPCPAGYRVPKRDKNQPLHSADLSAVEGWSEAAAEGDNAAYFTLGNPAAVFPYAGLVCENGKYIDHLGKRNFIWTAYCSSSPYIMDVRLGDAHKLNSTVTSRGCSVRCVAIDGWVDPSPAATPTLERVWGWYSGDNLWTANVTAISISHPDGYGMARGLAMDDEYIYLPKSSAYAAVAAIKITDPTTQVKGNVSGIAGGTSFVTSFARMMKNSDPSVNGGKDILLVSNLTETNSDANKLVIYAYTNGIEAAPVTLCAFAWDSANDTYDWRRYGDRFFVTGTWQEGKIYLPSFNSPKTVVLSVANGARTAVQQIHSGSNSPDGIKDLTVYPGGENIFLTNSSIANFLEPTGSTANGWDEYALLESSTKGLNTWGYNFFEFGGKKYIAYARMDGNKACVEVIEDQGTEVSFLASIDAQAGLLQAPVHSATDLAAEHATGGVADCCVRVIDGVPYIATLTRDGGLTVDKLVLK